MISVIVPVYNAQAYLGECLDSLLAQSYRDLDIIVVDDGSTDSSMNIARDYERRDARVRAISQRNGGPSSARNAGIKLSRGEYLCFMDADDVLHPRFAETLLRIMGKCDIAMCDFVRDDTCQWTSSTVDTKSGAVENGARAGAKDTVVKMAPEDAIEAGLYQHLTINAVWAKIYRRHIFDNIDFTESILYEDLDLFYKGIEAAGDGIAYTKEKLYFYRNTPGSLINTFTSRRLDVLSVTDRIEAHYVNNPRLLAAARDRKFAANYNMYLLTRGKPEYELAHLQCWQVIKKYRREVLANKQSRLKNKAGALLSYLGKGAVSLSAKICKL